MRIIALGALTVAVTSLLASGTAAVDPPAKDQQTYTGFDAATVCSDAGLSASDKSACRLELDSAKSDKARAEIRKRYEARLTAPSSEHTPAQQGLSPFENPSSP